MSSQTHGYYITLATKGLTDNIGILKATYPVAEVSHVYIKSIASNKHIRVINQKTEMYSCSEIQEKPVHYITSFK